MEKGYEIIMDTREHSSIKEMVRKIGLPFRMEALDCGDYALRNTNTKPYKLVAGIERKRIGDLVQSIQSQRLFDQISRVYMHYDIGYLFVSGSLAEQNARMKEMGFKINSSVVYGTLSSIIVRTGINVCWFPDDMTLLDCAYRTLEKISENKYLQPRRKRPKYEEYNPVAVLMRVPGVTQDKAKRLIAKFKDLEGIATRNPNQLTVVDGIGSSTANAIWRLFHMSG